MARPGRPDRTGPPGRRRRAARVAGPTLTALGVGHPDEAARRTRAGRLADRRRDRPHGRRAMEAIARDVGTDPITSATRSGSSCASATRPVGRGCWPAASAGADAVRAMRCGGRARRRRRTSSACAATRSGRRCASCAVPGGSRTCGPASRACERSSRRRRTDRRSLVTGATDERPAAGRRLRRHRSRPAPRRTRRHRRVPRLRS